MLPVAADLDIHRNNGTNDLLPPGAVITHTDSAAKASPPGISHSWTCTVGSNGKSVTTGDSQYSCAAPKGFGNSYYLTVKNVPRGTYTYSITFNSDYGDISSVALDFNPGSSTSVTVSITQRSSTVSGTVVEAANTATPIKGATVKLCTVDATTTTCPTVNNFSGTTVQATSTAADGMFQFTNIPDGSYKFVVTRDGYATNVSAISVNFDVTGTDHTVQLSEVLQSISLSLTTPADVASMTAVTLHQTSSAGRVSRDADRTINIASGTGTSADPYLTETDQVPTGTWTVLVSGAANAPFGLTGSAAINVATTTTSPVSVSATAVAATPTINFATPDCVAAPSGPISGYIWTASGTKPSTPNLSLAMASSAASQAVYLPRLAETYSWSPTLTGLIAWDPPATDPSTIKVDGSYVVTASSVNLTATTQEVTVTLAVDGKAPAAGETATVTATCPSGGPAIANHDKTTDTNGQATLVLTTGSTWDYALTASPAGDSCTLTGTGPITVACTSKASATVKILQSDNTATAEGATVTAVPSGGGTAISCSPTDAIGVSTCTGLTQSAGYNIGVTWTDAATSKNYVGSGPVTTDGAGTTKDAGTITLAPAPTTASATVTVVQSNATTPAEGATVTATPSGGTATSCTASTTAGEYRCDGLTPATTYAIDVTWTDSTSNEFAGSGTVTTAAAGSTTAASPDPIKVNTAP
jgi:hypothetical protein